MKGQLPSKATELLWMLVLREITSEIFIIWARLPLCFKMTILSSNKHQMHILFYVCICTGYIYDLFILTVCALKILGKILFVIVLPISGELPIHGL